MTGHKTIGALKKDILSALDAGMKTSLLIDVYSYSFLKLDLNGPEFVFECLMINTKKNRKYLTMMNSEKRQPFSHNEDDYGFDLPVFKWSDLCKYEKSFASE